MYALGKIGGFLHLYIGQEAVAVGAMSTLRPDDYAIAGYREHGHILAKGRDPGAIMAELFGKATACPRARAARCTCSTGRSTSGRPRDRGRVSPARGRRRVRHPVRDRRAGHPLLLRRRAVPQGEFHESMNLAALWKLPVVFVCENNRYAMGTAIQRALAQTDISKFAAAYACPARPATAWTSSRSGTASGAPWRAPGRATSRRSSRRGRTGSAATRCATPAAVYRTKDEVEEEKQRDPIVGLRERLRARGAARRGRLGHPGGCGWRRASTTRWRSPTPPGAAGRNG